MFVNDVPATTGICGIKLKAGEQLLFAAVSSTTSPGDPIEIKGSAGGPYTVDFVSSKGKVKPLSGATVKLEKAKSGTVVKSYTSNAKGVVTLGAGPGSYVVVASKTGYIRDETSFTAVS